jgi:DNA repair protein RecO (recombination protein O)
MEWSAEAIVIGARRHGETDIILEVVTAEHGRHLGLVKGGRSRRVRPVLQPGNTLALSWRARLHEHLGNFRAEPVKERSIALMSSSVGAFGLALAAAHLRLLPERDPHPRLFHAFATMLDCFDRPTLAAELMARFELIMLDDLGFGLDLESCAATGTRHDLIYVSPRSGRAVSRTAGKPYAERLLDLPAFLRKDGGGPADQASVEQAFRMTGFFLERHLLESRGQGLPAERGSFLKALSGVQAPVAAVN